MQAGASSSFTDQTRDLGLGELLPWSAVAFGFGIALFFAAKAEPSLVELLWCGSLLLAGAALILLSIRVIRRPVILTLGCLILCAASGFLTAMARTALVAAPVLEARYSGVIEGRVQAIDRSGSGALRVTLVDLELEPGRGEPGAPLPERVRISLVGDASDFAPVIGTRISLGGRLSPPAGPAEPGGFDFQRHAWFRGLGAVGYTRDAAITTLQGEAGLSLGTLRMGLSQAVQSRVDGQPGAFAAALMTGDRSGLTPESLSQMRAANIAHLLAISGLHMGLLTGFVFLAVQLALRLFGPGYYPLRNRKIAAIAALAAGAVYLLLSGGSVATERAFVQVAVMFVALLFERRALTLRSVALAALIVLMRRPETLLSPGFQMSFAATIALVVAFRGLASFNAGLGSVLRPGPVVSIFVSSLVAGLATAPFAAAHFNYVSSYGLLANLLTVPLMGTIVMPSAVIAALVSPFGAEGVPFWVMEHALSWILGVAELVATLPHSTRPVHAPAPFVLPSIALGGLIFCLCAGRIRWIGLLPLGLAILLWAQTERPAVLIAGDGSELVGVMTQGGRALSQEGGFVAQSWRQRDGEPGQGAQAHERVSWIPSGAGQSIEFEGLLVWQMQRRPTTEEVENACRTHDVVVVANWPEAPSRWLRSLQSATLDAILSTRPASWHLRTTARPTCWLVSPWVLMNSGAVAITSDVVGFRFVTTRMVQGTRRWSPRAWRE